MKLYILLLLLIINEAYSSQNMSSVPENNFCFASCFTAKEICIDVGNELIQRVTLGFVRNAAEESCISIFDQCKSFC